MNDFPVLRLVGREHGGYMLFLGQNLLIYSTTENGMYLVDNTYAIKETIEYSAWSAHYPTIGKFVQANFVIPTEQPKPAEHLNDPHYAQG
jgi:hypothetical protein